MSRDSQSYMVWFKQELAEGAKYGSTTNEPIYLFGSAFLTATALNDPQNLAQFGIDSIWFGRYFKRQAPLPTLDGGHRVMEKSQIRLKMDLQPNINPTPEWHAKLSAYLLEKLGINATEVDEIKLETTDICCHSPCYGCIAFDLEKALAQQGNQPFLLAMKAGYNARGVE
jgi:hypothetical protein